MDFKVFIEIPIGSSVKYEVDDETNELTVDRFLYTAFSYPFNYGYIVEAQGGDNDPLDVVVLSSQPVVPGVTMKCHAVGVLATEDEEGEDAKIIAVPDKKIDPFYGAYEDIKDVPEALLAKIKHFYENYKTLEPGKWVKIKDFASRAEAEKQIEEASSRAAKN
ncbi:inorganic pyrophosphatase [Candidatus Woesebacteria bacterium RIFCSPHIGHO2_01_FULL_44_10]|uniref:Inorganic pyrophosphatase n=1 Tax=Candidatus Woesebacteria bacterium RIFCSPLOWO2_01_FULL_44_14 TaxID=1802525 RepID=A0A1F8C469_9BACT|nr:MAG: inorganic pyrophosphatase [Candidatus Woesebacteria bacterium RIFCSPHIGHO2_01_FULL_44_10]OGM55723.1 MAG: inorganic pyrophosphatase [Candidatus Woesebacteria bacterium RIFCSPHIGHO2_12_FULL_44_11]OGM70508.1 MAG: inorganic pyrophosphatase [Candidatus Woesebacteria bacterium RIFCSPLOWO2_01_FULL_44_14]